MATSAASHSSSPIHPIPQLVPKSYSSILTVLPPPCSLSWRHYTDTAAHKDDIMDITFIIYKMVKRNIYMGGKHTCKFHSIILSFSVSCNAFLCTSCLSCPSCPFRVCRPPDRKLEVQTRRQACAGYTWSSHTPGNPPPIGGGGGR